jgi:hypothetical protein
VCPLTIIDARNARIVLRFSMPLMRKTLFYAPIVIKKPQSLCHRLRLYTRAPVFIQLTIVIQTLMRKKQKKQKPDGIIDSNAKTGVPTNDNGN